MKNLIILAGIAIAAATFYGCGTKEESTVTATNEPVQVKVQVVNKSEENVILQFNGKVIAANHANISTRMMGFVDQVKVKVGEKVKARIMSIDKEDKKIALSKKNAENADLGGFATEETTTSSLAEKLKGFNVKE